MTPEQQEIQSLKKQLWRAQMDNEILKKAHSLVCNGQSKHTMITKISKASKQYNTKELCRLFKHARSSYYYQVKDKPVNDNVNAMIKFIKQTAIEVGHTYGKRRMQVVLNNQGYNIGLYQTVTLMNKANVVAIRPRKRHYY
ncbi:Mobile element protein [uncultured Candidatus Thioglobus sp.]|nr:Mobile element protein [uncultured Candidatus Thioglobus sp.]